MPTFNTPSSVAVIFPSNDIPLPLFTKTSALVDLSQTLTVHLKLPLTGSGWLDAYGYSFLSGVAACDSHFTPFTFSCSHVPSSIMLLFAPLTLLVRWPFLSVLLLQYWIHSHAGAQGHCHRVPSQSDEHMTLFCKLFQNDLSRDTFYMFCLLLGTGDHDLNVQINHIYNISYLFLGIALVY